MNSCMVATYIGETRYVFNYNEGNYEETCTYITNSEHFNLNDTKLI